MARIYPELSTRLRAHLKLKLFLAVALNLWVFVPYHFLQHHHFFQPTMIPESFFDRLIPFSHQAVWIYLSIYLLMPIGPFLMKNQKDIARYALGIVTMGVLADVIFFLWPTWCPRPDTAGTNPLYQWLVQIDNPFHAIPSLHAAFAVYSALCAQRVIAQMQWSALARSAIWLWTSLILFATVATRQHTLADLLGGSLLAISVFSCAFNLSNRNPNPHRAVPALSIGTNSKRIQL